MKKVYINPEMQIIKVGTVQMIAASKMGYGDPTNTIDAPQLDFDEDEEDY